MEQEREYLKLLEILIAVAEANKGIIAKADDRLLDAEGLLQKFFAMLLPRSIFIEIHLSQI